jgi:L-threonate 2-dehydrogenase
VTSIALISPGLMGTAVGRALLSRGHAVYCALSRRSDATRQRAADSGFVCCDSLKEAILRSDIALSLVPPGQALNVARRFAECVRELPSAPVFVDCNSISPPTARAICGIIADAGATAVDCSIFGPADQIGAENIIVLNGTETRAIAGLFADLAEVRIAHGEFGDASAVKMAMSIVTKALPALFLEATCAAAASGQLDLMVSLFDRLYPGIMSFISRSLPTYPRHVSRRLDEMREIEIWLRDMGMSGAMTNGAQQNLDRLHHVGLAPDRKWDLIALLEAAARHGVLAARQEGTVAERLRTVPYAVLES